MERLKRMSYACALGVRGISYTIAVSATAEDYGSGVGAGFGHAVVGSAVGVFVCVGVIVCVGVGVGCMQSAGTSIPMGSVVIDVLPPSGQVSSGHIHAQESWHQHPLPS